MSEATHGSSMAEKLMLYHLVCGFFLLNKPTAPDTGIFGKARLAADLAIPVAAEAAMAPTLE